MRHFEIAQLPILALLVSAALLYLVVMVVSLVATVSMVSAGTAPAGSFHKVYIGDDGDYIYNWDFQDNPSVSSQNVDWGMRFLFAGSAVDVDYVKDRLDGYGQDPSLSPIIFDVGGNKRAYVSDGPEHTGSRWYSDRGKKNHINCQWNFAHVRIYAQSGEEHNYDATLGNYVAASIHRDSIKFFDDGWWLCNKKYKSTESVEGALRNRIRDGGLSDSPYNWSIGDRFNWRNSSGSGSPVVDIDGGTHKYQSDGYGTVIDVGQTP